MGLDSFKVAPDNEGGREKGSENEDEKRRVNGALTIYNDTKEYWKDQYGIVVGLGDPTDKDISELAERLHILPRTVKTKLTQHEIYEYEEFVEEEDTGLELLVSNAR